MCQCVSIADAIFAGPRPSSVLREGVDQDFAVRAVEHDHVAAGPGEERQIGAHVGDLERHRRELRAHLRERVGGLLQAGGKRPRKPSRQCRCDDGSTHEGESAFEDLTSGDRCGRALVVHGRLHLMTAVDWRKTRRIIPERPMKLMASAGRSCTLSPR
jgi:hypothetical protein